MNISKLTEPRDSVRVIVVGGLTIEIDAELLVDIAGDRIKVSAPIPAGAPPAPPVLPVPMSPVPWPWGGDTGGASTRVPCAFDGLPPGVYSLYCPCPRCSPQGGSTVQLRGGEQTSYTVANQSEFTSLVSVKVT
jgi:hypothetical protein